MTAEGAAALAEATENRSVSALVLNDVPLGEAVAERFRKCLAVNRTLCHLPGVPGVEELLQQNLLRQEQLAECARGGDLEGMRRLVREGVGREVSQQSGLTVYHLCMDLGRSDMLDLLLGPRARLYRHARTAARTRGRSNSCWLFLSGSCAFLFSLSPRSAACVELRRHVAERVVALFCAWGRRPEGCVLGLLSPELMAMIARRAFEGWCLRFRKRQTNT